MRYMLNLALSGIDGDIHRLVEFARLAEAAGWDGLSLEDYIVYPAHPRGVTFDPWLAMAAIAARTQRLRLAVLVTPLARRRPWKVAREAATLDHLSRGRAILGVGLGDGAAVDFTAFGETTAARQRAAMLDEALDIIVGLWRGEPFSYQGEHYQARDVTFLPTPVQTPRIPIWVGGGWPLRGPTRRAARWDGSCLYKHSDAGPSVDVTAADVRAMRADFERERSSAAPFDIVLGGTTPGDDRAATRARLAPLAEAGMTWWNELVMPSTTEPEAVRRRIGQGPPRLD
jgi:alkanesulfonate monooxygenase SsuD/methylene tetrahydromethanopterin reductase-like flavin-dependent oxidoreductase (luciferase family)